MEVGTDELFAQLISQTQPKYLLSREYHGNCTFDPSLNGGVQADGGFNDSAGGPEDGDPDSDSPLILRDTTGPYDYAVLSAANKQDMLDWLQEEEFFIPTGTDTVVDPYINPNSYFLALKLLPGGTSGDLQPIVIRYESNLPMIPITLTSVAADPDMGILVWMLGETRAIPRNYFHTVINDATIDWLNAGANYIDVINNAVDESNGHHSFVTEFAGSSERMLDILDYEGRFGDLEELAQIDDAVSFVDYLIYNGFAVFSNSGPFFGPQLSSQIVSILGSQLPSPAALLEQGITPVDYYGNMSYYLGWFRDENPELFEDLDIEFSPAELTAELDERVVQPTLDAGALFREFPYLTRLFTTLSPHEMNRDPVFSWGDNQLPDVSNIHTATITYFCGMYSDDRSTTPARLETEQGWVLELPDGEVGYDWGEVSMPFSQFTQIVREEGAAQNVQDNNAAIDSAIDDFRSPRTGCAVSPDAGSSRGLAILWLGMLGVLFVRRRMTV